MNPEALCSAAARRASSLVVAMRRIRASALRVTAASMLESAPAGRSVSSTPATPAACAAATKRSTPNAITGFRYVMMMTGTATAASRTRASTRGTFMPCSSAVWVVRWMVGPSASGSENGMPTSMKSAPAAATRRSASSDTSRFGNPAVRYGISARRRPSARHRSAMASDKVVADVDAVFDWVGNLDDGAWEIAVRILLGKIDDRAGVQEGAVRRRHDAHDGPVHMRDVGIGAVDERDFVGIEDDARDRKSVV